MDPSHYSGLHLNSTWPQQHAFHDWVRQDVNPQPQPDPLPRQSSDYIIAPKADYGPGPLEGVEADLEEPYRLGQNGWLQPNGSTSGFSPLPFQPIQSGHSIGSLFAGGGERAFKRYLNESAALDDNDSAEKPYSCEICGDRFCTSQGLAGHRIKHLDKGVKSQECRICHKEFASAQAVGGHMGVHKPDEFEDPTSTYYPDEYTCSHCHKHFNSRQALGGHVSLTKHKGLPPLPLHLIPFTLTEDPPPGHPPLPEQPLLEPPVMRNFLANSSSFRCEICGVRYMTEEGLEVHRQSAHPMCYPATPAGPPSPPPPEPEAPPLLPLGHKCVICGQEFPSADGLGAHMMSHQQEADRTRYSCEVCAKVFTNPLGLRSHRSQKHGLRFPFVEDRHREEREAAEAAAEEEAARLAEHHQQQQQQMSLQAEEEARSREQAPQQPYHPKPQRYPPRDFPHPVLHVQRLEQQVALQAQAQQLQRELLARQHPGLFEPPLGRPPQEAEPPPLLPCPACGQQFASQLAVDQHFAQLHAPRMFPAELEPTPRELPYHPEPARFEDRFGQTHRFLEQLPMHAYHDEQHEASSTLQDRLSRPPQALLDLQEGQGEVDEPEPQKPKRKRRKPGEEDTGDIKYRCTVCGKGFSTHQGLGGHMGKHGGKQMGPDGRPLRLRARSSRPGPSGLLSCGICGKEFASGQALGGHMGKHTDEERERIGHPPARRARASSLVPAGQQLSLAVGASRSPGRQSSAGSEEGWGTSEWGHGGG